MNDIITSLTQRVTAAEEDILRFFREIVAIPSMDSDIEQVGQRIGEEMRKLKYDEVYVENALGCFARHLNGDRGVRRISVLYSFRIRPGPPSSL